MMSERTQALRKLLSCEAVHRRLVITGHDNPDVDSVISCVLMQRLLAAWHIDAKIVLTTPADRQSHRVMTRFGFCPDEWLGETEAEDGLILVDHHQPLHAGDVLACVDHHGTPCPPQYPYTQIETCGACAAMVLRLMQEAEVPVSDEDTALAVTAMYLDTIALRSTKVLADEIIWAKVQVKRLDMDESWLLGEGLKLEDMTLPPQELARRGRKTYRFGGCTVISTYVQTDAMTPDRLNAILDVIRGEIRREEAALWVFLVHDPIGQRTMEYDVSADGSVCVIDHGCLASRGKDVMPRVEQMIRKAEEHNGGLS